MGEMAQLLNQLNGGKGHLPRPSRGRALLQRPDMVGPGMVRVQQWRPDTETEAKAQQRFGPAWDATLRTTPLPTCEAFGPAALRSVMRWACRKYKPLQRREPRPMAWLAAAAHCPAHSSPPWHHAVRAHGRLVAAAKPAARRTAIDGPSRCSARELLRGRFSPRRPGRTTAGPHAAPPVSRMT
jgi:hypothetical protein